MSESEAGLVGACILEPRLVPQAQGLVGPEDFRSEALGNLFRDVVGQYKANGEVEAHFGALGVTFDSEEDQP